MMEELHSSETFVLTRATWRNILEDAIPEKLRLQLVVMFSVISELYMFVYHMLLY
jgi:hypothetical protein